MTGAANSIATLLHRFNGELVALANNALAVQDALSPALSASPTIGVETMREFQRLDLIEQTLRDLADVAARASSLCPEDRNVDFADITRDCRLSDVAARLNGDGSDGPHSSDLELF